MFQNPYMRSQPTPSMIEQDAYSYSLNFPTALELIRNAVFGELDDEKNITKCSDRFTLN
jgi:hypothetical protein